MTSRATVRAREWVPVLAVAAAVGVWAWLAADADPMAFTDLRVYLYGGETVGTGRLYDVRDGLPYTYPPFAALVMVPLAGLPVPLAAALWSAAGVVVLAAAMRLVLRAAALPTPWWAPAACGAAALLLEPIWSSVSLGQVNLLVLGLVAADLLGRDRRTTGVMLGIAAGIKLTPLLLVAYLVLTGRVRAAVVAAATFAATVGLGLAITPGEAVTFWTEAIWDPDRVGGVAFGGNQSVHGLLARYLGGEPPAVVWVPVAALLAGWCLALAALLHRGPEPSRVMGVGVATLGMLLASPISWDHHWVWCAPIAVGLAAWLRRPWGLLRSLLAAGVWLAVFASDVVRWPPRGSDRELAWTPLQHLAGDAYVGAGLVLLVLVTAVLVTEVRASPADSARRPDAPQRT